MNRVNLLRETNVYDMFIDAFPWAIVSDDDYNAMCGIPSKSTCGIDCVIAIQSASMFMTNVRRAYGDDFPEMRDGIKETCLRVVMCFITG